jgi:8-oxo-dGTP pyrophosphatase MutT (NUDIX family)
MPQKYIVYFNQKSIVFNNLTPDFVRNLPVHILLGNDEQTIDNALELLENENDERTCIYLKAMDWEIGLSLLKTRFAFIRAAGGLIRNEDGKYLLIHRLGQWDLPKGKIEVAESDELAAEREIAEETGIVIDPPLHFLCSTWHTYTQKGKAYIKETVWFYGNSKQKSIPIAQSEEHIEMAIWCTAEEAGTKLRNSYPSIADVWNTLANLKALNL